MFVASHCQNTIREFESYSWKEVKLGQEDQNKPERPNKSNDHSMDAMRYFMYFHRFRDKKRGIKNRYKPADKITGY
jgi:phage terminase large subunit